MPLYGNRQNDGKVTYESDIQLGRRYRDSQTEVEGVATAVVFYQHACERVDLETVVQTPGGGKEIKSYAFDAPRLVDVETEAQATTTRTGGPGDDRLAAHGRGRADQR